MNGWQRITVALPEHQDRIGKHWAHKVAREIVKLASCCRVTKGRVMAIIKERINRILVNSTTVQARPILLEISLIDEDPQQPRSMNNPGFATSSLEELALTIRSRGIKTPISVRDNPDGNGRYIINHGARRFRAAKLVRQTHIPGFIDNDYLAVDQIIENMHRNELTAREIADYIGREIAKGKKKSSIASELGKSPAFITQHVTLLDLPHVIADAFHSGRVRDVTLVNELVSAYKKQPKEVTTWLHDPLQEITRGTVKLLREFLEDKAGQLVLENKFINENASTSPDSELDDSHDIVVSDIPSIKPSHPDKLKKAIIYVDYQGRLSRLVLKRRPSAEGLAWLRYEDTGHEVEVTLSDVALVSIREG